MPAALAPSGEYDGREHAEPAPEEAADKLSCRATGEDQRQVDADFRGGGPL
jgi:hypothetical protein